MHKAVWKGYLEDADWVASIQFIYFLCNFSTSRCCSQYKHLSNNMSHMMEVKQWCHLQIMTLYSIRSSREQLPWWLRRALCIMKLMLSRSSVETERLLPPRSTEGQTAHHDTAPLCSVLLPVLCSVLFFSSHPESLLPGGTRGGTVNHSWGYEKCVCDSGVWAVKPEQWAVKERSSSSMIQTVQGAHPPLCPILFLLPLGTYNSCTRVRAPPLNRHIMHRTVVYDAS